MAKDEKKYQVWTDYCSEGWSLEEFDNFSECVDYVKQGMGGSHKITKLVDNEIYKHTPSKARE